MDTMAVVLEEPKHLVLRRLELTTPGEDDVIVEVAWTGVSTGTERLLWSGAMPPFPGMGYPLVPGYEAVGQVVWTGARSGRSVGDWVFVPGSKGFAGAHGLFGAAARRLVAPGDRVVPVLEGMGEQACLLALAATAEHAIRGSAPIGESDAPNRPLGPALVVGHGALGRLLARLLMAREDAPPPMVWETNPDRRTDEDYPVLDPSADEGTEYETIYDVSGDPEILDVLIPRLRRGGEVVLGGFYARSVAFHFPPAFMKEARIRVAAEWVPRDLREVLKLLKEERMTLDGLVTHREMAAQAPDAYRTAFEDPRCVKMILDWRGTA
ncbi:MAG: chlorophyll synthesis pathway protein BchC [Gemmatimonadales bacterium]|nr:MAG: chlorophyll synthesis pathway protein BchC [Gemmatimonadales bacterium]